MNKNKEKLILRIIFFLALFLRLFRFTQVPPSLSWDEAAIGYNAYSILTTGKDEFDISYPLAFRSFGDYKSPLLIYLTVPFIGFLGLTETAIRLPSVIIGTLTVLVVYYLVKELLKKKDNFQIAGFKWQVSFMVGFLLALNPWHLHFSRGAFESNLALFLISLGFWMFLKGLKKPQFFLLSSLSFIFSFYAYHSPKIFLPFCLVVLAIIFKKEIFKKRNIKYLLLSLVLGIALGLPLLKAHLNGQAGARFISTGVFYTPEGIRKPIGVKLILELGKNYLTHFSPKFLFSGTDKNFRNGIREVGLFYWLEIPFLLLGFLSLVKQRKRKWVKFLLAWLLLTPLAAMVTRETPHRLRAFNMVAPLIIISALGIKEIALRLGKVNKKIFYLTLILGLLNFGYYFYSYHFKFPVYGAEDWQYGYKEMALYFKDKEDEVEQIIITDTYGQPHIFIQLFQEKEPLEIWGSAKYLFQKVGWENQKNLKNIYLVAADREASIASIPSEVKIEKEIYFPDGRAVFRIIKL